MYSQRQGCQASNDIRSSLTLWASLFPAWMQADKLQTGAIDAGSNPAIRTNFIIHNLNTFLSWYSKKNTLLTWKLATIEF